MRQDWAQYYDKVSEADADAGARLQELEQAGLAPDTIVFYYADHGSGMPRCKRWPATPGCMCRWSSTFPRSGEHLAPKEYRPGGQSDRMVSFVDFAPTLLSLVGIEPPAWMQGHAFAGPYQTEPPAFLFGERGRMDERQDLCAASPMAVTFICATTSRTSRRRSTVAYQFETPTTRVWRDWFDRGLTNEAQSIFWRVPESAEELYDLQTDPDEVHNLADSPEHRPVLERLRQAQRDHAAAIRDICFLPEGEIHSRSAGSTPYELARDDAKYPLRASWPPRNSLRILTPLRCRS